MIRSQYEEDVFPNNHKSVFGSYWRGGSWGYKCCYSFIKNSYCTGESGKQALDPQSLLEAVPSKESLPESSGMKTTGNDSGDDKDSSESSSDSSEDARTQTERKSKSKKNKKKKRKQKEKLRKKSVDPLKEALDQEMAHQREAERILKIDERKRPYNSMFTAKEPSAEQVEAFQMKRPREDDPMSKFI